MIRRISMLAVSIAAMAATWFAVSAAPVPVAAGESPLSVIPAQSPIVVHIRGVDRTRERIVALLKNAVPDMAGLAAGQIEQMLNEGLDGRKLKGLEKDGPVFVAFLELPTPDTEKPAMAVVAKVTNYAEFRDAFLTADEKASLKRENAGGERTEIKGQEVYFLDRAGWAVITPSKDVLGSFIKKSPGLDSRIHTDMARKLLDNDVSVYVDLAAVNKQFGDQIKEAKTQFFGLMDQFGGQDKATMDMVKKVYGSLFQVIEDGKAVVVGFEFRPEGLNWNGHAQIGAETATNKFLKDQKPAALADLGTMPGGRVIYSATEFAPSLFKALAPMLYGTVAEGESRKAAEAAINALVTAANSTSFSAGSFPASSFQVQMFKDPEKAVKAQLELLSAMGDGANFQNNAVKGKPEIKENDKEFKGFKLNFAKLTWDLDKLADQVPGGGEDVKKAMKKMLGEGLNIWFGTDGKKVITVSTKDWSAAEAEITAYLEGKNTIANEPAFVATRKQLTPEANMYMFVDAGKFSLIMGEYMLSLFKAIPGLPFNLPESMKPVETKPAFIGTSFSMRPEFGGFEFFLPATAVQEIRKVVMPLFLGGE